MKYFTALGLFSVVLTMVHGEKNWRDDGRCGVNYKLKNGEPAQCNPHDKDGNTCCSWSLGTCGKTLNHCKGYLSLGCWGDNVGHYSASYYGQLIVESYTGPRTFEECRELARERNHKVFAFKEHGRCAMGEFVDKYKDRGASAKCGEEGKGGPAAMNIYKVDADSYYVNYGPAAAEDMKSLKASEGAVEQGVDYYGADIRNFKSKGLRDCYNECKSQIDCVSFTMRKSDNYCWLKNKRNGAIRKTNQPHLLSVNMEMKSLGTGNCMTNAYRGHQNATRSGRICQNWTYKWPNKPWSKILIPNEETGVGNHNFCRNPDGGKGGPWCYVALGRKPRWEYCGTKCNYCKKISQLWFEMPSVFNSGTTNNVYMEVEQGNRKCTTKNPTWKRPDNCKWTGMFWPTNPKGVVKFAELDKNAGTCADTCFWTNWDLKFYVRTTGDNDIYITAIMARLGHEEIMHEWRTNIYKAIDDNENNGPYTATKSRRYYEGFRAGYARDDFNDGCRRCKKAKSGSGTTGCVKGSKSVPPAEGYQGLL